MRLFLSFILITLTASSLFAEPVPDVFIGKINLKNSSKLDTAAKKELSVFAAKIKKIKSSGTVMITGNIKGAKSQDEYNDKSVFMAKLAESYLKPLLSNRYQIFITSSKFQADNGNIFNSLQISLYPHELRVQGSGFISTMTSSEEIPKIIESGKQQKDSNPASQMQIPTSLLSKPVSENDQIEVGASNSKNKMKVDTEDPVLANELVNKAKARAAQKAKRLEQDK